LGIAFEAGSCRVSSRSAADALAEWWTRLEPRRLLSKAFSALILLRPTKWPTEPIARKVRRAYDAAMRQSDDDITVHGFPPDIPRLTAEPTISPGRACQDVSRASARQRVERVYRGSELLAQRRELLAAWGRLSRAGCPPSRAAFRVWLTTLSTFFQSRACGLQSPHSPALRNGCRLPLATLGIRRAYCHPRNCCSRELCRHGALLSWIHGTYRRWLSPHAPGHPKLRPVACGERARRSADCQLGEKSWGEFHNPPNPIISSSIWPCFSLGSLWVPVCKASARASEGSQRGLSWR
jgi:hypothetical protein